MSEENAKLTKSLKVIKEGYDFYQSQTHVKERLIEELENVVG